MKRWNAGVWAGMGVSLFSLTFLLLSLDFPYTGPAGPGPGFLPLWISGIMFILSIFYIWESVKDKDGTGEPMPRGAALKSVLFVLVILVLYLILMPILGFIAASALFLFTLFVRHYKWHISIGAAVLVTLVLFWLFGSVLNVDLPESTFGW
ncbi:tripartite tricarboxylate transporter TctB family protein [Brevibacillus thermoruber]|uniref:tripartite tricarboxylate transporter TctB family protein n=1 Tax=Brevibacillus thermoruber TaxID=33942 RepID=UPI00404299B5